MANIPECPPSLKPIQHYLKTAAEHDTRDPIVAYWCRLHALHTGLKLSTKKTPDQTAVLFALMNWLEEEKKANKDNEAISNEVAAQAHLENYALKLFLFADKQDREMNYGKIPALMNWLEEEKKANKDNEAISNEVAAQAHLENYALKLFLFADKQDREMNYGKNIVKAFYTAGMIYDVLTTFGELTEEATQNRKYAKWKAAYIHNCLKNGETPVPGPLQEDGNENSEEFSSEQPPAPVAPETPGFSVNSDPDLPRPVPSGFNNFLPDPNVAINAASQLPPVPYTPDPNPGGFVPYDPSQQPATTPLYGDTSSSNVELSPDQIAKAQKYCKWASSALSYDDIKTAVTNLRNALELLQTGRDPA